MGLLHLYSSHYVGSRKMFKIILTENTYKFDIEYEQYSKEYIRRQSQV